MNWPSARSSRASWPFSTVKRAPESFAARSKSIRPSASPISKCSFAQFGRGGTSPTLRISTLSCSSLPTGTSSSGTLGMHRQRVVERLVELALLGLGALDEAP